MTLKAPDQLYSLEVFITLRANPVSCRKECTDFSLTTPPRSPPHPDPRHRQRLELLSLTNENTRFAFAQLALPLKTSSRVRPVPPALCSSRFTLHTARAVPAHSFTSQLSQVWSHTALLGSHSQQVCIPQGGCRTQVIPASGGLLLCPL